MENSKILKVLTVVVIVLMILVGAAGTYYFYYQANLLKNQKEDCQNQLTSLESRLNSENEKEESSDCVSLSQEEKTKMDDWTSYTNDSLNYSFKYPSDWSLNEEELIVTAKKEGSSSEASFQVRANRATQIGFTGVDHTLTQEATVDCQSVQARYYEQKDPGSLNNIVYNISRDDNDYLLIFSYQDQGESLNKEVVEVGDLIVKSFSFSDK